MPSLLDWLLENEPLFRKSRLPSLYSDLKVQKETNPEGYAANLQAWQSALARAALAGQLPTEQLFILQTGDALVSALSSPQYGRPSGLGVVIDDSVREGKMIETKDFITTEQRISSIGSTNSNSKTWYSNWLPPSPWTVLRWGLGIGAGGAGGSYHYDNRAAASGKLRTGSSLVILPALEEISKRIEAWWLHDHRHSDSLTDRIISREDFAKQLPSILHTSPSSPSSSSQHAIASQDMDVLLRHLSRDRGLLSYNSNAIKFKPCSAAASTSSGNNAIINQAPDPITAEDSSIANLKQLISSLTAQCTALESSISTQQSRAARFVREKNKTSALAALRSKKRAEQALEQRASTLQQLEDVYHSIEQAADQIAIVETLQASATTLKSLNRKVGSVERVEDVIDELKEQMAQTDEVSTVLQLEPIGLAGAAAQAELDLDDELEAMERAERDRLHQEDTRKRLADEAVGKVPHAALPGGAGGAGQSADAEPELATSVEKMNALDLSG